MREVLRKIYLQFSSDWFDFKQTLYQVKCRIWNAGLLLFWNRLWIRRDESHRSLSLDDEAMEVMNNKQQERYRNELINRRIKAHEQDLDKE
jgi:hypothetical protein